VLLDDWDKSDEHDRHYDPFFTCTNGRSIRDPDCIKYNGQYLLTWNASIPSSGLIGFASSPDRTHFTFIGFSDLGINSGGAPLQWSPKFFVDATNGLHLTARSSNPGGILQFPVMVDVNPTNITLITNIRQFIRLMVAFWTLSPEKCFT